MRYSKSFKKFLLVVGVLIFLSPTRSVFADDPGITKARLIQQSDSTYILEVDVARNILYTIKTPVFPERFVMSDFDYTMESGWITLQLEVTSRGNPLNQEDEILLPWLRNGVDFTVRWSDGSTFKGLFNRSLNGIVIPLRELMPTVKSTQEVLRQGFISGLNHLTFKFVHILLVVVLFWNSSGSRGFKLLLWYALGGAIAMAVSEISPVSIDLLLSDLLILILVFILVYSVTYQKEFRYAFFIFLLVGLCHGLGYANELSGSGLPRLQVIQSMFAFNLAIDLFQFALAGLAVIVYRNLSSNSSIVRRTSVVAGSVTVFLILMIFSENVTKGNIRILDIEQTKPRINVPVASTQSTGAIQRGAGFMTTPIMVFLSVEPYEIRQEVLVDGRTAMQIIDPQYNAEVIPVQIQEQVKTILSDSVLNNSSLKIGDAIEVVDDLSVNFVQLSRGGVYIRESPLEERIEDAIIGITYIYDTESFPDSLHFDWGLYPTSVTSVETSVVDPYSNITAQLTQANHQISWGSRLTGSQLPEVEPISIEMYAIPFLSLTIWLLLIVYLFIQIVKRDTLKYQTWVITSLALAFVFYPFLRFDSSLPYAAQWSPSEERTGIILNDLLTNVYRAFDRRKENDVYDRLSLSVTGEQLTDIYLQNRQAMALENRGGARAKVDEIKILDVYNVKPSESEGYQADAMWTVRGSVNHFGHTHYRQNQYRALVSFVNEDEVWKISAIEPIEEKRIY